MTEYRATHLFEPHVEVCVQCRRTRLEIAFDGPQDCDGMIVWREWLHVEGPTPYWQKTAAMSGLEALEATKE